MRTIPIQDEPSRVGLSLVHGLRFLLFQYLPISAWAIENYSEWAKQLNNTAETSNSTKSINPTQVRDVMVHPVQTGCPENFHAMEVCLNCHPPV